MLALPVIMLTGFAFACLAMNMTALAPNYDFFMFYQTLVITPMMLLSGVFFPLSQLPAPIRAFTNLLPLPNAVELIRPLMLGRTPDNILLHLGVLVLYAVVALWLCLWLLRRRMLK